LKDKKIVVITTRGGSYSAGSLDFQEPYLRAVFELIGITDMRFIHAENLSGGTEVRQQSLAAARAAIQQFISNLHKQKFAQQD
jgi:FMN-dependent NADH-azoreductase